MEIRALRQSDDRTVFRSGEPDLDRFLQKYSGQNQFRHHIGTTYVAVDDAARVLGYATVAPGSLEVEDLPAGTRKSLPQYPMPILRLARLAVDGKVKGRGIGKALLRFVLDLALRMAEEYGCIGVAVDAKPGAVEFYRRRGFIPLDVVSGQSGGRPVPRLMFLSTEEIRAAKGMP